MGFGDELAPFTFSAAAWRRDGCQFVARDHRQLCVHFGLVRHRRSYAISSTDLAKTYCFLAYVILRWEVDRGVYCGGRVYSTHLQIVNGPCF